MDLGTLNWSKYPDASTNKTRWLAQLNITPKQIAYTDISDCYCDILPKTSYALVARGIQGIAVYGDGIRLFAEGKEDISISEFSQLVRGHILAYPIETEIVSTFAPNSPSLIKPTSVLTSYVSKMDVTYKAKKAEWWKYLVGIDHDIDLTDKNVTLEALVSIISNSNPKSAIVIALPSDAYKKCVSGGGWNGTISAELAKKPLVTLALK